MLPPSREELNELAEKWLKGTLTPGEKELLDKWYDADSAETIHWTGKDESEKALSHRLLVNIQQKKKATLFRRKWHIPAAAILLIALGTGSYFYFSKPHSNVQIAILQDVHPGKNKAVLTLANGQQVNLTDAVNGQIANQPGIKITKTADGILVYDASVDVSTKSAAPEYHTIEAPVGGQWQVKLPDGSLVFLNASSSISYPTRFVGKERKVHMNGEAYFEIAPNQKMPFRIVSQEQIVEVLGTHFNVMAYPDEKMIKTSLLEGSVKISHHGQSKLLKPGEQAQVSQDGIKITDDIDLEEAVAWKNGYFKFNESLESILAKVARWYDITVEYQVKPDPDLIFSGKISRARNISGILHMLEYNGDIHFIIKERRVIVTK